MLINKVRENRLELSEGTHCVDSVGLFDKHNNVQCIKEEIIIQLVSQTITIYNRL